MKKIIINILVLGLFVAQLVFLSACVNREGNISESKAKKIVQEGLKTLALVQDDPTEIRLKLYDNKGKGHAIPKWRADCIFRTTYDYHIWLAAETGEVMKITRYPIGWFESMGQGTFDTKKQKEYSEEEIIKAASDYLDTIGVSFEKAELLYGFEREELMLFHDDGPKILEIKNYRVDITFNREKNTSGVLVLLADDLSIQEVFLTNEG